MWVMVQPYTTTADEVIGTIPIGYAWMVGPEIYKGFHVIVDGQFCPIVERVSMDQITVRLPKVYPLGTPVTLMGENGGASITATEVAEKRGTINYEVLCLLSDRVPRVAMTNINKKEKSSLMLDFWFS